MSQQGGIDLRHFVFLHHRLAAPLSCRYGFQKGEDNRKPAASSRTLKSLDVFAPNDVTREFPTLHDWPSWLDVFGYIEMFCHPGASTPRMDTVACRIRTAAGNESRGRLENLELFRFWRSRSISSGFHSGSSSGVLGCAGAIQTEMVHSVQRSRISIICMTD